MALNPQIILGGQTPDIMGALDRGRVAAEGQIGLNRQNALAALYQDQGAQIMAGDQNALNALARMDPNAALGTQQNILGVQSARQDMDFTAKKMAALDTATQREAEAYAKSISAEQAAQEAAALEAGIKQALAAPTPEAFDALMVQSGRPEMVGQFDNREVLAAQFMSVAEILKMNAGPEPLSPADRYKVVGGSLFDLGAEGGPTQVGQGAMQETTVFGPDGKPVMVQGGPGTSVKFTEGQSKDNVYTARAEGALAKLEPVAEALTSRTARVAEMVPLGLARGFQGDEFQVAMNAGNEFLQAILRKDTGAAITADEQQLYGVTYLPQPGDGPAVLQAKAEARVRAIEAIRSGMNVDQLSAVARADQAAIARLAAMDGTAEQPSQAPATGARRLKFNPETGELE
jgi:hypothetical protein